MILKKPYKFLIKHFKLIHIIMFVIFMIFVLVLRNMHQFFISYVATGTFKYSTSLASEYVPWYVFFFAIITLVGGIVIHLLMKKKEKPVLFYKILIGYSVILIIFFGYYYSFFASLNETVYDPLRIVIHRDIATIIYYINYFYVGFSFIRGFGFDIKKFSFDKDKKELFIEEGDNEEYELNVEIDKDVIKSHLRREKREIKYYIKENATFFIILSTILVIALGISLYSFFFVKNRVYSEKDVVSFHDLDFSINKSIFTNTDKYGEIVSSNSNFVLVDLNIKNKSQALYNLDSEAFRININDKYYYPVYTYHKYFNDIEKGYNNTPIKPFSDTNYLLVFKVPKDENGKVYFEVLKAKAMEYTFYRYRLNLQSSTKINHENIITDNININGNSLILKQYSCAHNATYQYEECNDDKCIKMNKNVIPKTNENVLTLTFDDISFLSDDFIDNSFGIKYDNKVISGKNITLLARNNNVIYLSVSKLIDKANSLSLRISTRNDIYNIKMR